MRKFLRENRIFLILALTITILALLEVKAAALGLS